MSFEVFNIFNDLESLFNQIIIFSLNVEKNWHIIYFELVSFLEIEF